MNNLKKLISILSMIALIINFTFTGYAYAYEQNIFDDYIPEEVYQYASENYKSSLKAVLERPDLYGITGEEDSFELCKPYIVYNVDIEVQTPLYYFPICNRSGEIVLVMAIFYTEKGWSDSISFDISGELNKAKYLEQECIIYSDKDDICIENATCALTAEKLDGVQMKKYADKSFRNKVKEFKEKYKVTYDVNNDSHNPKDIVMGTGLKVSTSASTLLDIDGDKVNQIIDGEVKNVCWAAAVATIYNYTKNEKISAKDVCNKLNHRYTGGNIDDIAAAFSYYNPNYKHTKLQLGYGKIREYLKAEKPIYMLTECGNNGHAVTLVGQSKDNGKPYITIWNSSTEKYQAISYNDGCVCYAMQGVTYHWNGSFCYK